MTDRPDPPVDDAVELASRYLDGDLGVDERAAAEVDAEVMAWVERFGGVQRALREPVIVDATVRDAALAAALAELDAPTDLPAAPVVTGLAAARARRTRRLGSWLGAAAAAVAVAIGGVAVTGNFGGSTASDSDAERAPMTAAKADDGAERSSTEAENSTMAIEAPAAGGSAEDSTYADQTMAESADATVAASETTAAGAPATTTTLATADVTAAPAADLDDPADLQAYASAAPLSVPVDAAAPCAGVVSGVLVADDVTYAGAPAVVYRDDAARVVTVYAAERCTLLDSLQY